MYIHDLLSVGEYVADFTPSEIISFQSYNFCVGYCYIA